MKDYYAQQAESSRTGDGMAAPQLLGGPETNAMSSSPRYYGKGAEQVYGGKPQDVSRDLISQL